MTSAAAILAHRAMASSVPSAAAWTADRPWPGMPLFDDLSNAAGFTL
jgi:hypothetical protein